MHDLRALARYAVFAAFAASVLIALASWLVRTRRVSPFSALGRAFRAASDPVIRPVETRLVRVGGNPINAGWWLVVVVAVVGLVLLSLMDWLVGPILRLLPPMGALDWSPLAAWLALWILKQLLLSVVML